MPESTDLRAQFAHLSLIQAVHHAAKQYPGGIAALAGAYGYNANTFQQKINPALDHSWLNIKEFEDVLAATRSSLILDAVGRAANVTWFDLGMIQHAGDLDVLNTINALVQSVGRMCGDLHKALADGDVSRRELTRLENDLAQLTGCAAGIVELAKKYLRDGVAA